MHVPQLVDVAHSLGGLGNACILGQALSYKNLLPQVNLPTHERGIEGVAVWMGRAVSIAWCKDVFFKRKRSFRKRAVVNVWP